MSGAVAERLLERAHEVARLVDVLQRVPHGTGAVLMVEGAPGIGKTSLLDVAADLAGQEGLAVLRARGGELEQELAFGVVRDLLARRIAAASDKERAQLVSGVAAVALPALGLGGIQWPPAEEAAIRHGLTWLVADLSEQRPLALIVDDVQWSDAASAAWLAHLSRRVVELPVAVILAARPPSGEDEPPALATLRELPDLERLRPGRLERASVAALVRSFYAADADDRFVAACHDAAGGNPFHTHALLDAAAAQTIPPTAAGAGALAELAPEAVRRSVEAALRRAGENGRALAKACTILGETVELRHVAVLARLDATAASLAADRLADQSLLIRGRPLRFVHPILLSAVRQGMLPGEQTELHRRAADLFDGEGDERRAAAHLLEVEPAGDPTVVRTLMAATGQAAAEGAMAHAARLLERGLAEPPPAEDRASMLGLLGLARMSSRLGGAVQPLLAAADSTESPAERAGLLAYAGWATVWEDPELLGKVVQRITALPAESSEGRMRADAMLGTMTRLSGLPAQPSTAELIARAEPLTGDSPGERELLVAATVAAGIDGALPAQRLTSLALRALSHPEDMYPAAVFNGAQVALGAPDEVLTALDSKLAACQRGGYESLVDPLLQARVMANWILGNFREAEVDARLFWKIASDRPPGSAVRLAGLVVLMVVLAARGQTDEGLGLIEQHGPFAQESTYYPHDLLQLGAGLVALEAGDLGEAVDSLLELERAITRRGMQNAGWGPPHRPALVEALVCTGDLETARAVAEKDLRLARTFEAPGTLGYALRGMGLAVGGPEGRALIEEGVPLLEESGERDRLARALIDLGRALRLEGRPTDAREPLRRALDLAEHCGAELVAQRAFDELRAAGAKPRRRALSGSDSLTPSEARIARLAAEGRTNREIAQMLFVSTKTVETHLGHIYAKLAITGRDELAAALAG